MYDLKAKSKGLDMNVALRRVAPLVNHSIHEIKYDMTQNVTAFITYLCLGLKDLHLNLYTTKKHRSFEEFL